MSKKVEEKVDKTKEKKVDEYTENIVKLMMKSAANATKLSLEIIFNLASKSNSFEEFKTILGEYLGLKSKNKKTSAEDSGKDAK